MYDVAWFDNCVCCDPYRWNMQIQTGRDSDGHIVMALVSNLNLDKDQNWTKWSDLMADWDWQDERTEQTEWAQCTWVIFWWSPMIRSIRVWNEEIMLSKSENFTKILKIMNTMFTNSAVLRPVFSASFQYQREVLLDELLYQLVLFPKVLRNNSYVIV